MVFKDRPERNEGSTSVRPALYLSFPFYTAAIRPTSVSMWAKEGNQFFLSCCVDVCIPLCVWASKAFCMPSVWVRIHVYINSDFIHLSVFSSPPPPHPKVCLVLMVMGNRVRRQASGGARRSRQINDPTAAFRSELRHISFPTGRGKKNPPVLDYLQTPSLTPSPPVLSVLNALLPSPSMWTIIL